MYAIDYAIWFFCDGIGPKNFLLMLKYIKYGENQLLVKSLYFGTSPSSIWATLESSMIFLREHPPTYFFSL